MPDAAWRDPFVKMIDTVTSSRSPMVAMKTTEEYRFLRAVQEVAVEQNLRAQSELDRKRQSGERLGPTDRPEAHRRSFYHWTRTKGLVRVAGFNPDGTAVTEPKAIPFWPESEEEGSPTKNLNVVLSRMRDCTPSNQEAARRSIFPERATYILSDVGTMIEPVEGQQDHELIRTLRDVFGEMKPRLVTIILLGPRWPDIPELSDCVEIVDLPLPDRDVVMARVDTNERVAAKNNVPSGFDEEGKQELVTALLGLTENQIDRVLARSIKLAGDETGKGRVFGPEMLPHVIEEKAQLIKSVGCLEYLHPMDVSEAGGYEPVRKLLRRAALSRRERYSSMGIKLKGVIFTGVAGTGKGWWARIAGSVMGLPTIRLDMGAAMGSLVGQTEQNISQALKVIEAMGGSILWIDEFEKAVGGMASSDRTDGGTTARAVGKLLTWMSEQEGQAFVIACANDISKLPPELLRGGRFDDKLFFDLPPRADLLSILRVHLRRKKLSGDGVDLERVADEMFRKRLVAAEVEVIVKEAALNVLERVEGETEIVPTTEDFLAAVEQYTPLSRMNGKVIAAQQAYAKLNGFKSACDGAAMTVASEKDQEEAVRAIKAISTAISMEDEISLGDLN